ncbi:MAG: hypothetical protein K6U03_00865 [Firmicutes bacterium]|nr:hypothetical protein [Bacillota bacterium]
MRKEMIIPVYLNQRIVFDLLAMLEGGISHVTRVASAEKRADVDEHRYGADFGLSKALASLLSINISGDRKRVAETGGTVQKEEERIHTPASLFYRLRNQLRDEGLLQTVNESYSPKVHDLVEFSAAMSRNPLIQTMDSFISLMEMAVMFDDQSQAGKSNQKQAKRENERILKQMVAFIEKLKTGDTVDMIAEGIVGKSRAVVTLETEYLNDPTMADLVDGKFTVVGKVIRTVGSGEGAISLIRKSALTMMPKNILQGIMVNLTQLSKEQGFNLPELNWELPGPAFQVIPIAIFA